MRDRSGARVPPPLAFKPPPRGLLPGRVALSTRPFVPRPVHSRIYIGQCVRCTACYPRNFHAKRRLRQRSQAVPAAGKRWARDGNGGGEGKSGAGRGNRGGGRVSETEKDKN